MIDEKPLIKFKFLELQRKLIFILLVTLLFHQAFSEETDLIEIYNKAVAHDALLASVKFENQATQELISQGRSLFLPSITANIGYDEKDNERKILTSEISSNVLLSGDKADFHSYDYGITIKQHLLLSVIIDDSRTVHVPSHRAIAVVLDQSCHHPVAVARWAQVPRRVFVGCGCY